MQKPHSKHVRVLSTEQLQIAKGGQGIIPSAPKPPGGIGTTPTGVGTTPLDGTPLPA
jgi:hypothetical protein